MIKHFLLLVIIAMSNLSWGQAFVNGSFENTTASVACNYNLNNGAFNGLMSNTNAFGAANETDILVVGCFQPSIPDGIRAIGIAGTQDEVAMDLSIPLVAGNSYTISFWSYSETSFRVQGDVQIGVSTVNNNFGTLVYTAPTIDMTWVQHTFTFVAPVSGAFITARNVPGIIHWNHLDNFEFAGCTNPTIDLGNDTTLCIGDNLMLDATYPAATYLWQDNSTNATYNVTSAGQYIVEVTDACGTAIDTINVAYNDVPVVDLGNDTTLCTGATLLLDATNPSSTYLWQDNSTNATFNVTTAGTYTVDVTNSCGTTSETIIVSYDTLPIVDLGNDTTLCTGAALLLDAAYPASTYIWQDNSTNATFNVTTAGNYSVDVTNMCGTTSDAIVISYATVPVVDLGNDTTLCTGATLLLDATNPSSTYLWQDNSTNTTFNVTTAGTYSVDVTNMCGTTSDVIVITYNSLPIVDLGNDTSLCTGATLVLDVTNPASTYIWQDNSINATFNVTTAGTYSVDVTNMCGTVSDDIIVTYGTAPIIDLGNDTTLCPGATLLLDATNPSSSYLWQDNSTNATFNVTTAGTYMVGAMNNCGTDADTIIIAYDVPPTVDLGNDTSLCVGGSLLLDVTFPASTYLWQDNSTNATFNVTTAGTYTVDVTNFCGTSSDDITVDYISSPTVNIGNDTSLCTGSVLTLDATTPNTTYLWQDNSTNATFDVVQTGLYYVTVSNSCGSFTDSIDVQYNALFDIDLGNDTTICDGSTLLLSINEPNTTTVWQDLSVGPSYNVVQGGTYYATTSIGACIAQDTIQVLMVDAPYVDLGNDIMICEDEEIVLSPINPQPGSYVWNTGSTEQQILVTEFDTYILSVSNSCGTVVDSIVVGDMGCNCTFYLPNTFTPDGDEFNQGLRFVYDCVFYEFEFRIYNRWGETIFLSYDPDMAWDATYNGKLVKSDTYTWVLRYKKDFNAAEATEVLGHINVLR